MHAGERVPMCMSTIRECQERPAVRSRAHGRHAHAYWRRARMPAGSGMPVERHQMAHMHAGGGPTSGVARDEALQ
jgi:hypothetical protein